MRAPGAAELALTSEPGWRDRLDPVDRVFDLVGAPLSPAASICIRSARVLPRPARFARDCLPRASQGLLVPGGRLIFVGETSGGEPTFSGWSLMRTVTLTCYSSETLDRDELADAMDEIAGAVARGALRVADLTQVPLSQAARAHELLESGQLSCQLVLVP